MSLPSQESISISPLTHSLTHSFVCPFVHMASALWRVLHLDCVRCLELRDKLALGLACEGLNGNTQGTQWERQTRNNSNGGSHSRLCLLSVCWAQALTQVIRMTAPGGRRPCAPVCG